MRRLLQYPRVGDKTTVVPRRRLEGTDLDSGDRGCREGLLTPHPNIFDSVSSFSAAYSSVPFHFHPHWRVPGVSFGTRAHPFPSREVPGPAPASTPRRLNINEGALEYNTICTAKKSVRLASGSLVDPMVVVDPDLRFGNCVEERSRDGYCCQFPTTRIGFSSIEPATVSPELHEI